MLHQSVSVDQGYKFVRPGPNFLAKIFAQNRAIIQYDQFDICFFSLIF